MKVPHRIIAPAGESAGAVLMFHGLRASLSSLADPGQRMARAGMTAILIDAPHHGERHSEVLATMPDALSLPGHHVLLRILREARDEIPSLVDAALAMGHRKVAVAGVSFGAFIALAAATAEPRLVATASILGTPDWTPRDGAIPADLADAVAESPHRHPFTPPRPLLMLNGANDDNVRPGGARALAERLRPLHDAAGVPLVHREYAQTSHWPSGDVWEDMWSTTTSFLLAAFRA